MTAARNCGSLKGPKLSMKVNTVPLYLIYGIVRNKPLLVLVFVTTLR